MARKQAKCRKCGDRFDPKPYQIKKNDYLCPPCRRAYARDYAARRKAEGRPLGWRKGDPEKGRAAQRRYRKKPEVRKRNRRRRREKRASDPAFRRKLRARERVSSAVKSGSLERKPCEVCGEDDLVHAHHDDYRKPLDVRWLCPIHHAEVHKEERAS